MTYLIHYGAAVNRRNRDFQFPLTVFILKCIGSYKWLSLLRLLIGSGVDFDRDEYNYTRVIYHIIYYSNPALGRALLILLRQAGMVIREKHRQELREEVNSSDRWLQKYIDGKMPKLTQAELTRIRVRRKLIRRNNFRSNILPAIGLLPVSWDWKRYMSFGVLSEAPSTLEEHCRIAIRGYIHATHPGNMCKAINRLPLPKVLKRFVLSTEINFN